jgi:hypothetical protein
MALNNSATIQTGTVYRESGISNYIRHGDAYISNAYDARPHIQTYDVRLVCFPFSHTPIIASSARSIGSNTSSSGMPIGTWMVASIILILSLEKNFSGDTHELRALRIASVMNVSPTSYAAGERAQELVYILRLTAHQIRTIHPTKSLTRYHLEVHTLVPVFGIHHV